MTKPKRSAKQAVLRRDGGKCVLAGPRCTEIATTVDHWLPQCLGGTHVQENLVASCDNCNQDKGDMLPEEWWAHVREATGREWTHDDEGLRSRRVWSASEGTEDATLQHPLLPSSAEWTSWAGGDLG